MSDNEETFWRLNSKMETIRAQLQQTLEDGNITAFSRNTRALLKAIDYFDDLSCYCIPNYDCQRCQMLEGLIEDLSSPPPQSSQSSQSS